MKNKKLLVLSSPSGGGKTVVAKHIISKFEKFSFSISATTRKIRNGEVHGKDYYFLDIDDFKEKLSQNEFVEHEEIFGNYYGTLKSEVSSKLDNNTFVVFDIDVKGAFSIRDSFQEESLLIFLTPPDMLTLEQRLRNRGTESDEQVQTRLSRAKMEISTSDKFDYVIINQVLDDTFQKVEEIVNNHFKIG